MNPLGKYTTFTDSFQAPLVGHVKLSVMGSTQEMPGKAPPRAQRVTAAGVVKQIHSCSAVTGDALYKCF
jgi:hypothetical protein